MIKSFIATVAFSTVGACFCLSLPLALSIFAPGLLFLGRVRLRAGFPRAAIASGSIDAIALIKIMSIVETQNQPSSHLRYVLMR